MVNLRRLVAVEAGLGPVKDELEERGFTVTTLEEPGWRRADAIVVGGIDSNLASFQEASIAGPVVLAAGKTPEEVADEISTRLG
ncbi:MAG: YkuS family protein [Bacillota bacterium]